MTKAARHFMANQLINNESIQIANWLEKPVNYEIIRCGHFCIN